MSQDLQPPAEQPDALERPLALSVHHATRSRHWRFWLGLFQLISGLLVGYVSVVNTTMVSDQVQFFQAAGQRPPGGYLAGMIIVLVCFGFLSIAGVVIGIWNFKTLKTTARQPLIAAIVLSLMSTVLMVVFTTDPLANAGTIGMLILHALVSLWTVGILRLKKVPVPDSDVQVSV